MDYKSLAFQRRIADRVEGNCAHCQRLIAGNHTGDFHDWEDMTYFEATSPQGERILLCIPCARLFWIIL